MLLLERIFNFGCSLCIYIRKRLDQINICLMSLMGSMQVPLICPANADLDSTTVKASLLNGSGVRGGKVINRVSMFHHHSQRVKNKVVNCSSSLYPSSNESNSKAGNFKQDDTVYVNATVFQAAEMRSSSDGFMVMMKDGKLMRCVYNNPHSRHRPHDAQNPAIMLKLEDGTDRLLPIFVSEMPSMKLAAAVVNDVQIARPSMYEVVDEMITKMGYVVNFVRLTDRTFGSYLARLYLTKVGEEAENISFDLKPLDAINIAVKCKAPIQINKNLACNDGLRVLEYAKASGVQRFSRDDLFSAELDRPTSDKPCVDAKEFNLLRNMLVAVVEERYHDAAVWRDELNQLRSTWLWMFV